MKMIKPIKTETNTVILEVRKVNQSIYPHLDLPTIAVCGKWLLDAGFKPGDNAVGEVFEDAVLIRRVKKINKEDFNNWEKLPLQIGKTWWGGEPAGDLFTNYLRPAELTLYTIEARTELIKNYRLIPDEKGNVNVYQKFWQWNEVNDNVVPPLLAYADLINQNDRRCTETAQKINSRAMNYLLTPVAIQVLYGLDVILLFIFNIWCRFVDIKQQ